MGGEGMVTGSILIAEIQDMYLGTPSDLSSVRDKNTGQSSQTLKLTIVVGESVRALKNSRGRTAITLKFNTVQECSSYYLHLITLRQFLMLLHSSL